MLYREIKSHQNVHFSLILFQFILILHQGEPLKLSKVCEGILDNIGKELLFEVRAHDGQIFRLLDDFIMAKPLFEFLMIFGV